MASRPATGVQSRDRVADDHGVGIHEDLPHHEPDDLLAVEDRGGCGGLLQSRPEAIEGLGQFQARGLVRQAEVHRLDRAVHDALAAPQLGKTPTQFVEREQLLLVRDQQALDRPGNLAQLALELGALSGRCRALALLFEPAADLPAQEGRVGQQSDNLFPDQRIEVILAYGPVSASPSLVNTSQGDSRLMGGVHQTGGS